MSNEPPEIDRKKLMHALWDGVADHFDPDMNVSDEVYDWYEETIEQPISMILCHIYGHEPVRDQCGIPEHDFCVWCRTSMPNAAGDNDAAS